MFEAAQEGNFYAIGVDSDQKYIADDVIICSMKKEVGTSIYEAIKAYLNGDTSLWGTTWIADMSNGYVGIGYGEEAATQQVPDEVKARRGQGRSWRRRSPPARSSWRRRARNLHALPTCGAAKGRAASLLFQRK